MARKPWTPRRPNDAILKEKLEIMERVARATKNPPGPGSPPPTPASFGVRTEDVDRVTAALARHKEWASHTIIHAVIGWLVFAAALTASIAIIVIAGERIGPLGLLFAFADSAAAKTNHPITA